MKSKDVMDCTIFCCMTLDPYDWTSAKLKKCPWFQLITTAQQIWCGNNESQSQSHRANDYKTDCNGKMFLNLELSLS